MQGLRPLIGLEDHGGAVQDELHGQDEGDAVDDDPEPPDTLCRHELETLVPSELLDGSCLIHVRSFPPPAHQATLSTLGHLGGRFDATFCPRGGPVAAGSRCPRSGAADPQAATLDVRRARFRPVWPSGRACALGTVGAPTQGMFWNSA